MGPSLKPHKTRITKLGNTLEELIESSQHMVAFEIPITENEEESMDLLRTRIKSVQHRHNNISTTKTALESAVTSYQEAFNSLDDNHQQEERISQETYVDRAWDLTSSALSLLNKLDEKETELSSRLDNFAQAARRRERHLEAAPIPQSSNESSRWTTPPPYSSQLQSMLPRLQLPKFSGRRQEWGSFWAIFQATVDEQSIPTMIKFNYLLQSLVGEARQTAAQFQVVEASYQLVIEALMKKYGEDSSIIEDLLLQLETIKAEGTSTKLQANLLEQITAILTQLAAKGQDVNQRLILNLALRKFSAEIQTKALERRERLTDSQQWTWSALHNDLQDIINTKERIERSQELIKKPHTPPPALRGEDQGRRPIPACIYCKRSNHRSLECRTVPISERAAFLTRNQLCLNCGKPNHTAQNCRSQGCFRCGLKHHSSTCRRLLPPPNHEQSTGTAMKPQQINQPARIVPTSNVGRMQQRGTTQALPRPSRQNMVTIEEDSEPDRMSDSQDESRVNHVRDSNTQKTGALLLTGTAIIQGPTESRQVQVLMDTGSELSFIDSKLVDELQLKIEGTSILRLKTFGSKLAKEEKHRIVHVDLVDKIGDTHPCKLYDCAILTSRTAEPQLTEEDLSYIKKHGLQLSSKTDEEIQPRILLGCDYLWEMMNSEKHNLPSGMHLIGTKFGFMLSGKKKSLTTNAVSSVLHTSTKDKELDIWDNYWKMESSGIEEYTGTEKEGKKIQEDRILKKFKETIVRKPDGYYVRLPWKEPHEYLPDNKSIALARLKSLLRQYEDRKDFLQEFDNIFKDQLQKGIIEVVEEEAGRPRPKGQIIHYLAHQAVVNPEKRTTPKRIVFDASAHYAGKPSLNDVLHQGPLTIPNICGMLMRFRMGKIAMTADIEKAFLQVRLHEQDRDATRFLWLKNLSEPLSEDNIVTYRFTRVTFGLISSPFLLGATINFHLDTTESGNDFASQVKDNLYVDNLFITTDDRDEAVKQYKEVKRIFEDINMNMREFTTNDAEVRRHFAEKDQSTSTKCKVLGIEWLTNDDVLVARCDGEPLKRVTKRAVLHVNASVFDPLGWLTPLMIRNKYFFQQLWLKPYGWDDVLSEEDQEQWKKLWESIAGFTKQLPRKLGSKQGNYQLIACSDASSYALAAVIYIRQGTEQHLLIAKSKLPSLKMPHTIPKLEVNALTIAGRLLLSTFEELKKTININSVYLLSDSEIALSWLKNESPQKATGVLVANRIKEIKKIARKLEQEGVKAYFGYINTKINPADCATRGLTAAELQNHMWWDGPPTSLTDENGTHEGLDRFQIPPEPAEVLQISNLDHPTLLHWERFSSFRRLKRTVAYVGKFLTKLTRNSPEELKDKVRRATGVQGNTGHIQGVDLVQAERTIIKLHQKEHEALIAANEQQKLNITRDDNGIWRCFGRLGNSCLQEDAKNPIFIAPNTHLAKLIIREAHGKLHCGLGLTMAEVRKQYWIPKLRQQAKKEIQRCVPCQKFNNLPFRYPPLADLPARRVVRSRPFQNIGLDLFGPLKTRSNDNIVSKAYGCIFTCATTRLMHIELVLDSSTTAFMNALRRFMSRRGVPDSITCDNATNFALAERIATDCLKSDEVDEFFANSHITWTKITPYAPWQGGFYERLIKDVKQSLYKSLGRKIIDEDSLRTVLVEIEGTLNNRPLTYLEENPDEIVPVRPIDFVQNRLVITYSFEEDDFSNREDPNFLPPEEAAQLRTQNEAKSALHASQRLTEGFWKLWKDSYLTSLREQHRRHLQQGRSSPKLPRVGQVVLIQDPFLSRNAWKMGLITNLGTENPNQIRQVELRMPNGRVTKRPVNSLIPLELLDSGTRHEHLSTHENPPTPSEPSSEPASDNPGRPKRNPSRQYPYSPEEYEINSISIDETSVTQSNTSIFRMANDPHEFIDNFMNTFKERSSMFEESELQRRLDVVYDEMTKLIEQRHKIEESYSQLKEKASVFDSDPVRAKPLYDLKKELIAAIEHLKQRWEKVQVVTHLLWEVYDRLVEQDASRFFSRQMFENRPRLAGRSNSKDSNIFIIREETEVLRGKQEALEVMDIVPFLNPYVDNLDAPYVTEDVDIHTKLDDIERQLQRLIDHTNTSKRSPDIESILRKLQRIESMLREEKVRRVEETASQQLQQVTTLIEEKSRYLEGKISDGNELIVNSMINLMTQISAILRTDHPSEQQRSITTSETPHKQRKDWTRPPAKRPPRHPEYALLRRRLDHLAQCDKRLYGHDAPEPSQHHRCSFCHGPHMEDACTEYKYVEERRAVVQDRNLCIFCLNNSCSKPCAERMPCRYCKSTSHHYSLCSLPEERSCLEDQLAHYQQ